MTNEFMMATFLEATYTKKEGTVTSYYWQQGTRILPNRLSISPNLLSDVQRKGRAVANGLMVGQCKGQFKIKEESPLKVCKPFYITTSIWQHPNWLQFIGYGTIGFSDKSSPRGIADLGDLLIFYTEDSDWDTVRIFYFAGMGANPDTLNEAMRYANTMINHLSMKKGHTSQQPLQMDI